jgi:hypothetical protein
MTPDPKWLDVLKDSDDRLAVAIACGLFLLVGHWGWLPSLADWVNPLAWFGLLLFGCMWVLKLLPPVFFVALELIVLWLRKPR